VPAYPDLAIPLRTAIVNSTAVMDNMPAYSSGDAVFTRRPVPLDAPFPMIVIGPSISGQDEGGLNDQRLSIMRDVAIYGKNDTPASYRLCETVSFSVRDLFHRNPNVIVVSGWKVVQIWARGPIETPVDQPDQNVARTVELSISLSAVMT